MKSPGLRGLRPLIAVNSAILSGIRHDLGRLFAIPVSYANWRATMQANISLYRSGDYGPWLGEHECFLAAQQIMHGTGFVGTFPFLEMGLPQVLAALRGA